MRDSLVGLGSIPKDVKQAIEETIEKMQKSTEDLNAASETNNKNIEKLNEAIDTKIAEIEHHISDQLKQHQQNTLKAINESFVGRKEGNQNESTNITEAMIDNFLSSTSNASIAFLYIIDRYCRKVQENKINPPVVNLKDLAVAINSGKRDDSFGMYLFACLVILSSFGLLVYDTCEDTITEVKFLSINSYVKSKIESQLLERNITSALEDLNQYMDSLFSNANQQEDDKNDGTKID